MPFQFVSGKYNFDGSITVFARNELGVKEPLKILGFKPYFYVPQDEPIGSVVEGLRKVNLGFRGVYGEETKQLVMRNPSDVGDGRDFFSKHWEAKVKFVRRFVIDCGITSGFDTLVKGKKVLHYKDLIPCEFSLKALENFLDIECYTSGRFPNPNRASEKVTCATVWDTRLMCYITILLDPDASDVRTYEELGEDHRLYRVRTEKDLLLSLKRYYVRLNPDIGAEWNKFDFDFVKVRGKRHGIDFSCFESVCLVDMLGAYATLYKKASNRLKDVVFDEGIIDWIEPEVDYGKLWRKDKMGLVERNKRHVEWMVKLNEKKAGGDLLGHFWDRKNIVGLEGVQETLYTGVLVHTLMLRRFHGKYVLPTKEKRTKGEDLLGALVKKPPVGMFKDVAVFDMSRYYPNIIIALNLSPENPPEGVRGIVPETCQYLLDERDKYEKQLSKLVLDSPEYKSLKSVRDGIKYVGEGVIGCFGSLSNPLYNPPIFKKVISTSREGLLVLEKAVEERGFRSLYYDTDGVYVHMDGGDAMKLALELNKVMVGWSKEKGMNTDMKLKCDRVFSNILFKGVKKRVAGVVCLADLKRNKVWKSRGPNIPIGEVKVDDKLIAYDFINQTFSETKVKKVFSRDCNYYLRIELERNKDAPCSKPQGGSQKPIIATVEHPFYTSRGWVRADQLKEGDELFFISKSDKIKFRVKIDPIFKAKLAEHSVENTTTPEAIQKIREKSRRTWHERRKEFLGYLSKVNAKAHTPEAIEKSRKTSLERGVYEASSRRMKLKNPMDNPHSRYLAVKNRLKRPSYLEQLFIDLFVNENLPIDYVGDGTLWTGVLERDSNSGRFKKGLGRQMNPDFKVHNQKKVIEVYGKKSIKTRGKKYEKERKEHYKKFGYSCLVLPVDTRRFDGKELLKEIIPFLHNGVKITNIRPSRRRITKAINLHCEPFNNFFVNGVLVHNCWEDGKDCDYLYIQGFDYVRRDSSLVTRKVQRETFEKLLRGKPKELIGFLQQTIRDMKGSKYTLREVAIKKTLKMKFESYKVKMDFVRGSIYANRHLGADIRSEDTVHMLYVNHVGGGKPLTDVLCFLDEEQVPKGTRINWSKMVDRTVKRKVEDLIALGGLSWAQVKGTRKLTEVF